jgi:hypothetical protein
MARKLSTTFNRIIALSPVNEVAVLPSKEEIDEMHLLRLKQSFGFSAESSDDAKADAEENLKREKISQLRQLETVLLVEQDH